MEKYKWVIYAILSAVFWGFDYAISEKILKENISALTLLMIEAIFSILIFFFILPYQRMVTDYYHIISNNKLLIKVILVAFTFNIGNILIFNAINEKNATFASLIELTYPIFTILFTWIIFRTHYITWGVLLAATLLFAGVIILAVF